VSSTVARVVLTQHPVVSKGPFTLFLDRPGYNIKSIDTGCAVFFLSSSCLQILG